MPTIDLGPVVGPAGPQGAAGPAGPQGSPGPNSITAATGTTYTGALVGANGAVTARPIDDAVGANSHLVTGAAVSAAVAGREPVSDVLFNGETEITAGATVTLDTARWRDYLALGFVFNTVSGNPSNHRITVSAFGQLVQLGTLLPLRKHTGSVDINEAVALGAVSGQPSQIAFSQFSKTTEQNLYLIGVYGMK